MMVSGEAVAMRKLVIAGYSEQELSQCYKGTVMGLARMTLAWGRGEEHELERANNLFFLTCYSYNYFFFKIRKRLILSDKGQLDWKKMYFKLIRCYPRKEQYGDTLQLCRHCHILSWKVWMRCWWDKLDWGRSHGAASASSDCSWFRVLQFLCLYNLVFSYILILPQLLSPFLLCASEIQSLHWTRVVAIKARGEGHGHTVGLPAITHLSTASNSFYPLRGDGDLGKD